MLNVYETQFLPKWAIAKYTKLIVFDSLRLVCETYRIHNRIID